VDTLFNLSLKLEGLTRSYGKHAGGVIITDLPLVNYAPLMTDEEGAVVVQYDKDAAEKVGLVKFDFLGLKTLTHIQRAVNLINEKW
jgi:DNA polymerase-3 subunit alpha